MYVPVSNNDVLIDSLEVINALRTDQDPALARFAALAAETFPGWETGIILVRDSYMNEYVKKMMLSVPVSGSSPKCHNSLLAYINWDSVAHDYIATCSSVDYDGVLYYSSLGSAILNS